MTPGPISDPYPGPMDPVFPLRRILRRERYQTDSHPHGTWSVWLWLECGHELRRKGSEEPRTKARCRECPMEGR